MKSRSHRLPINEPPDDWGDGSWTVDCVCGVNFDDGEEMVNCDECGVWVHTRCSRFVKGEKSFACDKCKSRKNRNETEETEVAQLLVELPTKTMTMDNNNPYPSSAPPKSSFRLWTEIPIEERVHVQGVPGGDPALFQGLSSVFTSELWKCSGYVPKKFNFQYREFPCWDEKKEQVARVNEEIENPVDRGADALFSLSKEIVSASPVEMLVGLRGSAEGASREKKLPKKDGKKQERNDSSDRYLHNGVMREPNHLRPSGPHLGKRKKDIIRSKDLSGKKKARSASKEVDGKKRVFTTAIGAQQKESLKVGEPKVVETDFQDHKNGDKTTLLHPDPDGCLDVNSNRPKDNSAVNVHYAGDSLKNVKPKDSLAAHVHHAEDLTKKAKRRDNFAAYSEDSSKRVKPKVSLEVNNHHADDSFKKGKSKDGKSKDKLFSKSHHAEDFSKKVKPKHNLATNASQGEDTPKEAWRNSSLVEIVVKSENDHQAPLRTGSSSETVAVEVSLLEPTGISFTKKHEDFNTSIDGSDHLNDDKHDPGDLHVNSSNTASASPKLKPLVGVSGNVSTEMQDSRVLQDSIESTPSNFLRPDSKVKTDANDDQPKGNFGALSSLTVDVKLDSTEHLDQHLKISVSEHAYENLQVHETNKSIFPSDENATTELKAISCCDKSNIIEGMIPVSSETCQNKEVVGSAGTLSVQEISSQPKQLKIAEETLETGGINPIPSSQITQRKVGLGFGKSLSSTVVISKSEGSGSCRPPGRPASPSTLRPIHFTKRVKANSSADIKKDHTVIEAAVREDFTHEEPRKTAKEQLKASTTSALKSSHMSRISHASCSKRTSSDSKEPVLYPPSKAPIALNGAVSSGSIESTSTLQSQSVSHVQNTATASSFSEKGERFNHSGSHHSSRVIHLSSMHPPAPVNSSSTLSDEELALLLHQELNSSPRVPRVPRVRHTGSSPQLASPTATSLLIKCTTSSGVKDHSVFRRKSKEEAPKDGSRNSRELIDETKKIDKVLSSHDHRRQEQAIASDGSTKKEAVGGSPEMGHSDKKNTSLASTTFGQSFSTEATDQNVSSVRTSPRNSSDDVDDDASKIAGPATRTLPGLLDEIMSKGKRMTYEELCNAVLPHWNNLRKHNGERYAYSSHSQAVLDCLRNRNEWAQLVDRGPKTNAGRKKRKLEPEPSSVELGGNEYGNKSRTTKELVGKSFEAHPEDFPKGKRKARKRRRLALQGRGIRDVRKRQTTNAVTDDDQGPFSHSSDNGDIVSEDSQGVRTRPIGSEVSSSLDEAGFL